MEHKLGALDDVAIAPIAPEHIDSFHRGLDLVARERQYLDISDAGSLARFCDYIEKQISNGDPFFVALAQGEVVGWCDIERHASRRMSILERSILRSFLDFEIVV